MPLFRSRRSGCCFRLLLTFLVLAIVGIWFLYWVLSRAIVSSSPNGTSTSTPSSVGVGDIQAVFSLLPKLVGMDKPRTILVLFQNNTELRPSGGFIGSYTVINIDKGQPKILVTEGTESLDRRTPTGWRPVPPEPITKYLKVDRWYFRDSNWSPDFPTSVRKALEFYRAEGGVGASDIDTVIAITPTVLERLLELIGPVTVNGITFTPEKVIETLEYEVEYGYADKGLTFADRKNIMQPLVLEVVKKVSTHGIANIPTYAAALARLSHEKQIQVWSTDTTIQKDADRHGWSGRLPTSTGDEIVWVDANLGALKTDRVMVRTLGYSLQPLKDGKYEATVVMEYKHEGTFDWRTSRYQSYTRLFVPDGSKLLKTEVVDANGKVIQSPTAEVGKELGREWFGTFIVIQPGETKKLRFVYEVSSQVAALVKKNNYTLLVHKQAGTIAHGLTLSLNFGTSITRATPAETGKAEDSAYEFAGDLREDREFKINF